MFQTLASLSQFRLLLGLIVFHLYRNRKQFLLRLRVAHHKRHVHQWFHGFRISDRHQHAFIFFATSHIHLTVLLGQSHGSGSPFCHNGTDDTRNKNDNDHPVQHILVHEKHARFHLYLRTHHHHSQGTGCMGITQTEHHLTGRLRHAIDKLRKPSSHPLGQSSHYNHDYYYLNGITSIEQRSQIDKHPHSYQEIRNEQRIAHKLGTVHQWRHTRDKTVQHQSGQKGTENTFHTCQLSQGCTKEHQRQNEDILHHIVLVLAEEPTGKSRENQKDKGTIYHTLTDKQDPRTGVQFTSINT